MLVHVQIELHRLMDKKIYLLKKKNMEMMEWMKPIKKYPYYHIMDKNDADI